MLGGVGVTHRGTWFKKTVIVPRAKRITLRFNAIFLDTWDNEYYYVEANGKKVW